MSSDTGTPVEDLGGQSSVSTLELFFDLVFVFTITQLTHAFVVEPTWVTAGEVAIVFCLTWWMYSGFIWLTGEVAPSTSSRRTMLLVGMLGFFAIALAVPDAVHGRGVIFGWAFFGVTVLHAIVYWTAGGADSGRVIGRLLPINLGAAVLAVIGGYAGGAAGFAWWGVAVVALAFLPRRTASADGFIVRPGHYCERHGAVVIIAVGESIVAVGAGLAGVPMNLLFFVEVGLGLTLCYVLWWAFFGFDHERGIRVLEALPVKERNRPALYAYGYACVPMLLGIVFTAAGLGMTIARTSSSATWAEAIALSGGVALYMFGQAGFRVVLGLPRPWIRAVAGVIALAIIPIGAFGEVWMELVAILVFVYAAVIADDLLIGKEGEHSSYL
ncbi:low temperature requirement protein A [Gordonia phthalatica]|uniref:Low temperature requirement protein A n=1 Tax=Gordonia phthalatica TaxID=1136941 RepID=A0A0N9NAE1_9ACTN|nr:low temperature requirement protein A [Gordonia phthalatica]ALG84345.1 low temperature requirement protein A [Gordonia phthalatica]